MKKSQLDLPPAMVPSSVAPLTPFNAAVVVTSVAASQKIVAATLNADADATLGVVTKTEERRQNLPYFVQKPMTQTIPVKLPDYIIELLKGQARQKGVSLQTLIKATLAASVSVSMAEEQS